MDNIPTISLREFLDGRLGSEDQHALARACEDHGFFLLRDHGAEDIVSEVFRQAQDFFAQPHAVKSELYRNESNPLGYYDRELTKHKRDQKEVYDFKAGGYISSNPERQTRWPQQPREFRSSLTEFFTTFTALSDHTMRLIFESLGMQAAMAGEYVQNSFGEQHSSAARLNYYPAHDPVPAEERGSATSLGDMALHHHTDPGAITLLLQDDLGGLQTRSKKYGWLDVEPQAGTIVVNVGDVLQVWTNDRCTAAIHRVLPVKQSVGRYSVPFFYQPKYDATIEPWCGEGEQARYRSFSWRDFIRGRVTDNFSELDTEDIQITKYRIAS